MKQYYDIVQWAQDCAMPLPELLKAAQNTAGILCLITDKIDAEVLRAAGPSLKIVSTMSVGYDHIDVPILTQHHIKVGNTPGVLTDACADLAVAMILAHARRLVEGTEKVKHGDWPDFSPTWMCGSQFTGKTLGVFGMGRIGRAIAHRLLPFGISKVVYTARNPDTLEHRNQDERLHTIGSYYQLQDVKTVPFDELLRQSDILCITCSPTPETRGIFNKDAFRKMKSTAVLVNSARGPIVNTQDLEQALNEGTIAGACLDVTDPEPLDAVKHQSLINHPKVFILPHISSATLETREHMAAIALDNLERGLTDRPLLHQVE